MLKDMKSPEYQKIKSDILTQFGVVSSDGFDVNSAIRTRIDYLKRFLRETGLRGFVLGISGGVDSYSAGRLAQLACLELRQEGFDARFIAMRLPNGIQHDEDHAQLAVQSIEPDMVLDVNIAAAVNALNNEIIEDLSHSGLDMSLEDIDFHKGNIKARTRMTAQYYVAGVYRCAVIGTDHNSECVTGFFTKFGDGAADLIVLNGLNKTQVRLVAKALGAPSTIYEKPPTADLEELNPGKLDDVGFGFEYSKLDAFLEGKEIDADTELKIINQYLRTQHKRDPIVSFS